MTSFPLEGSRAGRDTHGEVKFSTGETPSDESKRLLAPTDVLPRQRPSSSSLRYIVPSSSSVDQLYPPPPSLPQHRKALSSEVAGKNLSWSINYFRTALRHDRDMKVLKLRNTTTVMLIGE